MYIFYLLFMIDTRFYSVFFLKSNDILTMDYISRHDQRSYEALLQKYTDAKHAAICETYSRIKQNVSRLR